MTETRHRLEGLEPDNLLAFLALLGLLRSLEAADRGRPAIKKLHPRASWDVDHPPLRPVLHLAAPTSENEVAQIAAEGLTILADSYELGKASRPDLNYSRNEALALLHDTANIATYSSRDRADLLAALMTDAAIKESKNFETAPVDPTPLCLLFGQGHQHFLERLIKVPKEHSPPPRRRGNHISAAECLSEALFAPWHREDPTTFSFRWDPEEDVRYALRAGNPTDPSYKGGTQHGANRLGAIGLGALSLVPEMRGGRVRPSVIGGAFGADGFSFAWPIWSEPVTLSAIRSLLSHPNLRKSHNLDYLSIDRVLITRRISVGKFMNFTRARTLSQS